MDKPFYLLDKLRFEIDNCLPQISAANESKIELHALTHGNYPGKPLKPEQLPAISSIGFMNAVGEQDWGHEPHRNEGVEISFQENGSNILMVDGKKYTIPAKTITITRPWQLHKIGDPYIGSGRVHWLILDLGVRRPNQAWQWPEWCILTDADQKELEQLLRGNEHPAWRANQEIQSAFKRIQQCIIAEPIDQYISHLTLHLNQILLSLLELLRTQNIVTEEHLTTKARTVEVFLSELESNYKLASYKWTLELMAQHCGMARTALSNHCQQLTNTSPILFLNQCRLQHAAKLLLDDSTQSVTQLALNLGFSNSQYFSRCFKEKYGAPPNQWRKSVAN